MQLMAVQNTAPLPRSAMLQVTAESCRGVQDQEDSAQWDQAVQEKAAKEQALEAALSGSTADGTGAGLVHLAARTPHLATGRMSKICTATVYTSLEAALSGSTADGTDECSAQLAIGSPRVESGGHALQGCPRRLLPRWHRYEVCPNYSRSPSLSFEDLHCTVRASTEAALTGITAYGIGTGHIHLAIRCPHFAVQGPA